MAQETTLQLWDLSQQLFGGVDPLCRMRRPKKPGGFARPTAHVLEVGPYLLTINYYTDAKCTSTVRSTGLMLPPT